MKEGFFLEVRRQLVNNVNSGINLSTVGNELKNNNLIEYT